MSKLYLVLGIIVGIVATLLIQFSIPTATSGEGPTHVSVGTIAVIQALPVFVALEKGFFEEEGLDVSVTSIQTSNDMIKAVVNKEIDFGASLSTTVVFDIEQKSPNTVKIVSVTRQTIERPTASVIVGKDSTFTSLSDLDGKRIALFPGTTALTLTRVSFQNVVSGDFQLRFVQLPTEFWLKALSTGQADAIIAYEPFVTLAVEEGVGRVLYSALWEKNVMDNIPSGASIVSAEYASKNPENVKMIRNALHKAVEFIEGNEQEARRISLKYLPISENVAMKLTLPLWRVGNDINIDYVQQYADILYDYGEIFQKVDASKFVLTE